MATVVVALGSNVGDRHQHLRDAANFLADLSETNLQKSSIYITEPVGPSTRDFFNAVVAMTTEDKPRTLIKKFKTFEHEHGRAASQPKWSARTIDLDIISYGDLVIQTDNLIIPHPEYHKRRFVLEPLAEIMPQWSDPGTKQNIAELLEKAPELRLQKTDLRW
ncbi:2-amino-4-hydroxy-6-hydroxymethyldihydropteridine diphosphokinase [Fodinibius sp. Rm-B-1B1-1]|uniref:2-amino-4-hydroxy-6- hydroxymethyldihydropteridine diphosphokinase n=1 Tax=Fodinibius alkaliphilus TaxID=3140241 RepID=UPI00315ABA3E